MRTIPFVTLLSTLLFLACEKQEVEALETPMTTASCENCVRLNDLKVGQVSFFKKFKGTSVYHDENPEILYLEDTLRLEVTAQNGMVFTLKENLTSNPEETWQYNIRVEKSGFAFVKAKEYFVSNLFSNKNIGSTFMPFELKEAPEAQMKGWYIFDECDLKPCFYFIEQFNDTGEKVNVYLDYSPMAYDGNGFYALYNEELIFRTLSVGAWTGEAEGWDLIR